MPNNTKDTLREGMKQLWEEYMDYLLEQGKQFNDEYKQIDYFIAWIIK